MKKFMLMLVFVLISALGLNAQGITLPYYQDFSSFSGGDMVSDASSSATAVSTMPTGIASVNSAFQAGEAMRIGTSSGVGGFTTQNIIAGSNPKVKVKFKAVPCPNTTLQPAKVIITYGTQSQTVVLAAPTHSWAVLEADLLPYSVEFNAEQAPTAIAVTTVAEAGHGNSIFIDNIRVIEIMTGVPLTEGFEGSVFPPQGWERVHARGNQMWQAVTNSAFAHSGNKYIEVQYSPQGHNNWLITPQLLPVSGQELKYWIRAESAPFEGTTVKVKVSTTDNDTSDFTTILKTYQTGDNTNLFDENWDEDTISLSAYVGMPIYIAFQVIDGGGSGIYLDDISMPNLLIQDCPTPSDFTVASSTSSTAELTWVSNTTISSNFVIEYSTSFAFSTDVVTHTVSDSYNLSLSNLQGNTVYYARIKLDCMGDENSSWSNIVFRTPCSVLTNTMVEQFTNYDPSNLSPHCWTKIMGYSDVFMSYPYVYNSLGHADNTSLYFYTESSAPTQIMATPEFSEPLTGLEAVLWLKRASTEYASKFEIGVMSDLAEANTFVSIQDITPANTSWQPYSVILTNAPATHKYIAFKMTLLGTGTNDAVSYYLDDINIHPIPTCATPSNVLINNIGDNAVKMSFTVNGTQNEWQYIITNNPDITDLSALTPTDITSSTNIDITNLNASTQYRVWVRAKCSPTEFSSWSIQPTIFTTNCTSVSFGWSDTFTNFNINSNNLPICWTRVAGIGLSGLYPRVSTSVGYGDNKSLYFYMPRNSNVILMATPEISNPLSGAEVTFHLKKEFASQNAIFEIGTMSDKNDQNTFTQVQIINPNNINWQFYNISLSNVQSSDRYVAFRMSAPGYEEAGYFLDSIDIHAIPTCVTPSNLRAIDVRENLATISFVPVANQTSWQYAISDNLALTEPTTLTAVDITNDTVTISGLTASTSYKVWLRTKCSQSEFSAWYPAITIKTMCPATSTISNDFESNQLGTIPECWTKISMVANPYIVAPKPINGMITQSILFTGSKPQFLVMPKFNAPLSELQLEFKLNREGEESGEFQVGYMSNPYDSNTFVAVATFNDPDTHYKSLLSKTVYFNSVPDNNGVNRYIAFRYGDVGNTMVDEMYYYYIDDVLVSPKPTCSYPINITANNITSNTATLTFVSTGTETNWIMEYKKSSEANWISTGNITTLSHQLTSLLPNTQYDVRIKAICSQTDQSAFSAVYNFKTLCETITLPFTENFTTQPSNCWGYYNISASYVFNNGLINEGGSWNYSSTDNAGITAPKMKVSILGEDENSWLVTPTIALSGSNKKLEFDIAYTKAGSSAPAEQTGLDDKFIVAIGTVDAAGNTTWSATHSTIWDNSGATGSNVLNNVPNTPQHITIDLTAYSGNIKVGFYTESTEENANNNLSLDNISITNVVISPPTVTTQPADAITSTTATLHKEVTQGTEPIAESGFFYKAVISTDWTKIQIDMITGLTPATEYEFYAYATVGTTVYRGDTMRFITATNVGLDIATQNIKLYPNPAKDVIKLMVDGLSSKADVSLIDMQGKVVGRYEIAKGNNSISIDVSSFAEGSYIVKVTSDNFNRTERLIIKK